MSKDDNKLEPAKLSQRGVSRRLFTDTISRALLEKDSKRLRALVEKLIGFAEHDAITVPDFLQIMKFLAERTDGKPHQSIELTDNSAELPSATQFKIVKVEPPTDDN